MDFGIFYKLKIKKAWWINVVFYFSVSFFVSAVFCWLLFILKIYFQERKITQLDADIAAIGTESQREQEKTVFENQKRIDDFAKLIEKRGFSSHIFNLLEKSVLPDIWFDRFGMVEKQNRINLSGEAESIDVLSRQTAAFEQNELVVKVSLLGSKMGVAGRVDFNLSLLLDPKVFEYVAPAVRVATVPAPPPEINGISGVLGTGDIIATVTPQDLQAVKPKNSGIVFLVVAIIVLVGALTAGAAFLIFKNKKKKIFMDKIN